MDISKPFRAGGNSTGRTIRRASISAHRERTDVPNRFGGIQVREDIKGNKGNHNGVHLAKKTKLKEGKTNMKRTILLSSAVVCAAAVCLAAPPAELVIESPVAKPSAPQTVQKPEEIKTEKEKGKQVVTAAGMQDAVNKAVTMEEEVCIVKCKSGSGYVAMGTASYEKYRNRNATLIGQRQAFVKALTVAKKRLAVFLEGMSVEDQQKLSEEITMIDKMSGEGAEAMVSELDTRTTSGAVSSLLRGCMIYKVSENNGNIKVWIYTSPVTRSGNLELNSNVTMVSRETFDNSFKQFYAQLKSGFCPPEGSRIFLIRNADGSVLPYFVGYGSQIIRKVNGAAALQSKAVEKAKNDADLYAAASLCRALTGDKTAWSGRVSEIVSKQAKSPGYEKVVAELKDDPVNQDKKLNATAGNAADSFISVSRSTDVYTSATKGRLPVGCQHFSWTDENGDWAYACIVFNPQMTGKIQAEKNKTVRGSVPAAAPAGTKKTDEIKPIRGEGELL